MSNNNNENNINKIANYVRIVYENNSVDNVKNNRKSE